MKILIWKELRENRSWAALGLAGLLVAEIFALSTGRDAFNNDSAGVTLCSTTFLLVSVFGCVAIGAALGALQIVPERRRDQWASLLHRPVSRETIFLGKVVAGLLLYGLATIVPLLISAGYAAWPGRFAAPFVPKMMLPAASDILLGTVFYFVALLLGMHSGKWAGSRGVIALAALAVLFLHLGGGWPILLPLVACAIFGTAAAGSIHGAVRLRIWPSRLALGMVILAGSAAAALFVCFALLLISAPLNVFPDSTSLSITKEGKILRVTYEQARKTTTIHDMDGNLITDERFRQNGGQEMFLSAYFLASRDQIPWPNFKNARTSRAYLETVAGSYNGPEVWYRIPGPRSYFIGYDKLSARCIGICDAEGFKDASAQPHPFPHDLVGDWYQAPPLLYRVGAVVQSFDFAERQMKTLYDAGRDTLYGAVRFPYNVEPQRIAVAMEHSVVILDLDGKTLLTAPYGHDPNVWTSLAITALPDFSRTFLQYAPSFSSAPKRTAKTTHLDVIDAQGQTISSYSAPVSEPATLPPTLLQRIAGLTLMPVPTLIATMTSRDESPSTLPEAALIFTFDEDRYSFVPLFTWALILSGAAGFWAHRAGLSRPRMALWIALTFTFGIAGFVAYRLTTDWPARIRCPQCRRFRSVNTDTCPHCQEAWTTPAPNGAEIFEPTA